MSIFNQFCNFLEAIGGPLFVTVMLVMLLMIAVVFVLSVVDYITNELAQKFFEPVKQEVDKETINHNKRR